MAAHLTSRLAVSPGLAVGSSVAWRRNSSRAATRLAGMGRNAAHLPALSSPSNAPGQRRHLARASASVGASTYVRVAADPAQSPTPASLLLEAAEAAARKGSEVVLAAADKPREIAYKGTADLVTDTDQRTEEAVLAEIRARFPNHLVLGEEGGITGDASSDYLWCVDPLDGTTNFAHGYPCFATSVAVLFRGRPIAACIIEYTGGPYSWIAKTYTASAGGGAFCDGRPIQASTTPNVGKALLVTGFGYEHDDPWAVNIELFKHFTDVSRGVRRLGAAAVDMCHVAIGITDAYWEYRLKPWDMAGGVLVVEEAGGIVTRMDGKPYSVFDRSVLVSNSTIHAEMLATLQPATEKLVADGKFEDSLWYKPDGYVADV